MAARNARETKEKKAKDEPVKTAPYVVFARRFRPQSFSDVVGQQTVTAALRQGLKTGRLAQAYLLAGPRGVGKTSLARIFAKALNCQNGKGPNGVAEEPCNECPACESIQNGSALDVIEMDAATHRGIDQIRELRDNVGLAPSGLRFKVYIVDEVHMLTTEAWNAFLKTLEEPPPHVRFIFATTDADRIPETILSRCQRFDLRRIGLPEIVQRLAQICKSEGLEAEPGALERIAGLAKGGLRDAEGLLDQAVNLGEGKISAEMVRQISGAAPDEMIFAILTACAEGKTAEALQQAGAALEAGADPDDLLDAFLDRLRGTLLAKTCGADSPLLEGQTHLKPAYAALGGQLSEDQLLMLMQLFSAARRQTRDAAQARLPLELALVRAARARELTDLGQLVTALASAPPARAAAPLAGSAPRPGSTYGGGAYGAREGPRPNSVGRPQGVPDARPAAETTAVAGVAVPAPAGVSPAVPPRAEPAGTGGSPVAPRTSSAPPARFERWEELLAAARKTPGGGFLAGALSFAATVRLDLAAGRLELAFAPAQLFYLETLERPERKTLLEAALAQTYGRPLEVVLTRAPAGVAAPAMAWHPPVQERAPAPARPDADSREASARPASPARGPRTPPDREEEALAEASAAAEPSVDFVDVGALPLPEAPVVDGGEEGSAPELTDDEVPAAAGAGRAPDELQQALQAVVRPKPAGREAPPPGPPKGNVREHPLVQAVLAQFGGEIMRVERLAKKTGK